MRIAGLAPYAKHVDHVNAKVCLTKDLEYHYTIYYMSIYYTHNTHPGRLVTVGLRKFYPPLPFAHSS
jgi:hypothetical protein